MRYSGNYLAALGGSVSAAAIMISGSQLSGCGKPSMTDKCSDQVAVVKAEICAASYRQNRTASQRLAFTLEAIDRHIIDVGVPVEELKHLFGDDWVELGDDGSGRCSARVNFEKIIPIGPVSDDPEAPRASPMVSGWYLQVDYTARGAVQKYWLSNIHKEMPNGPLNRR